MFTKKGEYRNRTKEAFTDMDTNMNWFLHQLGQELRTYDDLNTPHHSGTYSENLYKAALSAVSYFNATHANWGRRFNSKWFRRVLDIDLPIAMRGLEKDGKDISLLALK